MAARPRAAAASAGSRAAATDRKIYTAALELLREGGPDAVTVESVAEHSGVARTTIYRRHRDRQDVLAAALDAHAAVRPFPTGGHLADDLAAAMDDLARAVVQQLGVGIFIVLLRPDEHELAERVREHFIRPRVRLVAQRLERAVADGEIAGCPDPEAIAEVLLGSVASHYASVGSFAPGWAARLVTLLWPAISAVPAGQR